LLFLLVRCRLAGYLCFGSLPVPQIVGVSCSDDCKRSGTVLFLEDLRSGGGGDEHSFVLERVLLGLYRGELERFLFLELTTLSLGALCWVLVSLFDPEEDLDTSSIEVLLCVSFDFFPPPDREVLDSAEPDEEPLLL
jgi:hypothetical protein